MNTRQTMRIRDDPDMALRRRDVNDEEYDPHWRDRLLPGKQEIYDKDREQARRRHQESTARNIERRYASRGAPGPRLHRPQGRVTGPNPREWNTGAAVTPHPGEARRLTVTGFNLLVERARMLRLAQGPSVSLPVCQSPTGFSGTSTPASPTRPTIQGRRRLQVPDQHRPLYREEKSQNTSPVLAATCDVARTLEPYLERVTQVLERLEALAQRPSPAPTPRPKLRVPTPTKPKQRTVIQTKQRKVIAKNTYGTCGNNIYGGTGAQSTPPREALGSDVSDTPPSGGATPRHFSSEAPGPAGRDSEARRV